MTRLLRLPLVALLSLLAACAGVDQIRKQNYLDEPSSARSERIHVVKRGDTLFKISRKYGVKVTDLKRLNGITNVRDIPVGMRLRIPGGGRVASGGEAPSTSGKPSGGVYDAPVSSSVRFAWPLKRIELSSPFGIRGNHKHDGLDLRAPRGTDVFASADGEVIFSGWGPAGYGNLIILKHDAVFISVYAHNQRNLVKKGATVKKGEHIAAVGSTGRASGAHLHFEIRKNRKPIDPMNHLPSR
ncbi:MAG: peptidoglycan DD-metalloendopeptidase family protein [Nitrospinae bacterium]|nr:peptidoglycan DD-metalloendopeptidase family protein [Nitrospinota bacterium]